MDFNTILTRFGLDSSNFVNKFLEPIKTDEGFIYEVDEAYKERICPFCNHQFMNVHDYNWIQIKLNSTIGVNEIIRIRRIRYYCSACKKTHTFNLSGINRSSSISRFTKNEIIKEFYTLQSFSDIARRYNVSTNTIINIFDEYTKIMPRRRLPEYLCVDEKHFEGDSYGKYVVILSDFTTGEVIDVIENRQMPYLDRYFSNIDISERRKVKVFISDMYEGYSTVKNKYFPNAMFVIDLFHVIRLLTTAVNKIRIRTYNQIAYEDSLEKHFMKTNWRYFLLDQFKIYKNEYYSKKYDISIPYQDIILRCLKLNITFWDGYSIMQELLKYSYKETWTDALNFIDRIIDKLYLSNDELLIKVAATYQKWKIGIANGLAKNQSDKRFSNAIAENNNSHIQRVINVAYGYTNFKRFRAKIMLLLTYKKQR